MKMQKSLHPDWFSRWYIQLMKLKRLENREPENFSQHSFETDVIFFAIVTE